MNTKGKRNFASNNSATLYCINPTTICSKGFNNIYNYYYDEYSRAFNKYKEIYKVSKSEAEKYLTMAQQDLLNRLKKDSTGYFSRWTPSFIFQVYNAVSRKCRTNRLKVKKNIDDEIFIRFTDIFEDCIVDTFTCVAIQKIKEILCHNGQSNAKLNAKLDDYKRLLDHIRDIEKDFNSPDEQKSKVAFYNYLKFVMKKMYINETLDILRPFSENIGDMNLYICCILDMMYSHYDCSRQDIASTFTEYFARVEYYFYNRCDKFAEIYDSEEDEDYDR